MEKEYHFETLKEIIDVLEEKNLGTFLTDFSRWLAVEVAMKGQKEGDAITLKHSGTMRWIDDGKTDVKISIEIK